MAKFRRSLAKILANHVDAPYDPEQRGFIEKIATALYERPECFPRWPESVRYFYACYDLNHQVGSGGFAQAAYLFSFSRRTYFAARIVVRPIE